MSRKYFDPVDYNLSNEFRLTKLSDLKGWGCKVPRDVLHRLLEEFQPADKNGDGDGHNPTNHSALTPESKLTPVIGMLIKYLIKTDLFFQDNFHRDWPWFMCYTITSWRIFFGTINRFLLSTCRWSICDGKYWFE